MTTPLTSDEIDKIRSFIPQMEEATRQAEYSFAKRLIWDRWRGIVIGTAAVITGAYVLYDAVRGGIKALMVWGGQ